MVVVGLRQDSGERSARPSDINLLSFLLQVRALHLHGTPAVTHMSPEVREKGLLGESFLGLPE